MFKIQISTETSNHNLRKSVATNKNLIMRNRYFKFQNPVQTPIGARPGLGTQPRYEASGDLQDENVKRSD